jgi:poly(ADP-ribose) glycohydrolase ARH3
MLGTAIGDALGQRAFAKSLSGLPPRKGLLTYTDSTAMTIGVAECLAQMKRISEKHLGDRLKANWRREAHRGYTAGPSTIFRMVEDPGISYREAAQSLFKGSGSLGNGGAVRVTPVGLFFFDSQELYAQAESSAVITHVHPLAIDGTVVMAFAIAEAARLHPKDPLQAGRFCDALNACARTAEFRSRIRQIHNAIEKELPPEEAAGVLGRSRRARDSVPFAIYSFLANPNSFKECLFCAIGNGGDRDALGAMACALSGAYLGAESIPLEWRERLENHDYIEKLAILLWQLRTGASR